MGMKRYKVWKQVFRSLNLCTIKHMQTCEKTAPHAVRYVICMCA